MTKEVTPSLHQLQEPLSLINECNSHILMSETNHATMNVEINSHIPGFSIYTKMSLHIENPEFNSFTLGLSPSWTFKQLRSKRRQPLALPSLIIHRRTPAITPSRQPRATSVCLLPQPELWRGYTSVTPCSNRPLVPPSLGSDPLITIEPSLTLSTVPSSHHRLAVTVTFNTPYLLSWI